MSMTMKPMTIDIPNLRGKHKGNISNTTNIGDDVAFAGAILLCIIFTATIITAKYNIVMTTVNSTTATPASPNLFNDF